MHDSDDGQDRSATPTGPARDVGASAGEARAGELPPTGLPAFAVQLRRMNSEFNRIAHDFAQSQNLHITDMQALVAILDGDAEGAAMTPGRLREQLNLTSGAVTACLDRLERAGHLRRVRDSTDRRVVHLHYEPAARNVARDYFRPLARATEAAREQFSEEELAVAVGFLAAMNDELGRLRRPGS